MEVRTLYTLLKGLDSPWFSSIKRIFFQQQSSIKSEDWCSKNGENVWSKFEPSFLYCFPGTRSTQQCLPTLCQLSGWPQHGTCGLSSPVYSRATLLLSDLTMPASHLCVLLACLLGGCTALVRDGQYYQDFCFRLTGSSIAWPSPDVRDNYTQCGLFDPENIIATRSVSAKTINTLYSIDIVFGIRSSAEFSKFQGRQMSSYSQDI